MIPQDHRWNYFLNDGAFGSFRFYKDDNYSVFASPQLLTSPSEGAPLTKSTLWGPTCCSTDEIITDIALPELSIGDWLYFENMGAYTGAVSFPVQWISQPWDSVLHLSD